MKRNENVIEERISALTECCWERYTETVEITFDPTKHKSPAEAQILLNQTTILSMISYLLQKDN